MQCWSSVGSGRDACWDIQRQVAEAAEFLPQGPCDVTLAVESFPCVCLCSQAVLETPQYSRGLDSHPVFFFSFLNQAEKFSIALGLESKQVLQQFLYSEIPLC